MTIVDQPTLKLQLFDNYIPALEPKDYTITVQQTAKDAKNPQEKELDHSFKRSQVFTVAGPRFTLPSEDVHGFYPPAQHSGLFGLDLPHIVLNKREIPWERWIWGDDAKSTPWIALLVLERSEVLAPTIGTNRPSDASTSPDLKGPNPTGVTTVTLNELLNPESSDVAVPKVTEESIKDEHFDPSTDKCQVIDVAPATFREAVAGRTDLPYFAHCRLVEITHKADNPEHHPDRDADDPSSAWYSVVIGSRFPRTPKAGEGPAPHVAHLVSLEGLTHAVDPAGATDPLAGKKRVRLVSLASWAFSVEPAAASSFAAIMHGLVTMPDGTKLDADDLMLRPPITPLASEDGTKSQNLAGAALSAGYTAMSFRTRQGERSFGWYHGPFTPSLAAPLPEGRPDPFMRASQAMIYDPATGVFDLSYAVAFETGRLKALASKSFGTNLLAWRRQIGRFIDLFAERSKQNESLEGMLSNAAGREKVRELLEENLLTESFLDQLTTRFAQEVAHTLHAETPQIPDVQGILPRPGETNDPVHKALEKIMQSADVHALIEAIDSELLDPIVQFLARMYLLYDVPFDGLVGDPRALPPESVRFFYLDRNWLEALVEGALSIGIHSSRDELFGAVTRGLIRDAVHALLHGLRDTMLGLTTAGSDDAGEGVFSGFLLRSSAVSGWPGMEIHPYAKARVDAAFATDEQVYAQSASEPLKPLRISKISQDVLLCLFPKVPAWIEFDQPKEGLHFGAQEKEESAVVAYARHVDAGDQTGALIGGKDSEIPVPYDPVKSPHRNLVLGDAQGGLLKEIQDKVPELKQLPGPAAFAMQMFFTPQSMVFQNTAFPTPPSDS